jgi:Secretion system C-terminal sorting domain
MKKLIVFITTTLLILKANAQKYDYHWVFGQKSSTTDSIHGGTDLNFNLTPLEIKGVERQTRFQATNVSICDEEGYFKFATNGIEIIGIDQEIIENGTELNPGETAELFPDGYICPQGIIALPDFNQSNTYFLVHLRLLYDANAIVDKIFYTTVDMSQNGGKGKVMEKNVPILSDSLSYHMLTAVRHGNGRDWWVFKPEKLSNGYWRILFTPWGFQPAQKQHIGHSFSVDDGRGQAVFSPDGTKYARYDIRNDLHIFDFDRCTGELSNPDSIEIHDLSDTLSGAGGAAFSPNSRYLYVPSLTKLYQFDTWADDVAASKVVVGEWDGFSSPFSTTFFMAQLGPDGRIYINGTNSVNVLHVIHEPDSAGLACNFEQHAIITPTLVLQGMPHFPNYRLGKWAGSPCDSMLTSGSVEMAAGKDGELSVYPNPAQAYFTADMTLLDYSGKSKTEILVSDALGRVVANHVFSAYSSMHRFEISALPQGYYFVALLQDGKVVDRKGLVIQR